MKTLCYAFKNVHPKVVEAVTAVIRDFYPKDDEAKAATLNELGIKLCELYQVPMLNIILDPGFSLFGRYSSEPQEIKLRKPSMVSFLHEFRHHLQFCKPDIKRFGDWEIDAQAWATSVFRLAAPVTFKKAVMNRSILGLIMVGGKVKNDQLVTGRDYLM